MSLLDDVMSCHRHNWSDKLSRARQIIQKGKGDVQGAHRLLEDERQAREQLVNFIELIEAHRRLEDAIPLAYESAKKYLTNDIIDLIYPRDPGGTYMADRAGMKILTRWAA